MYKQLIKLIKLITILGAIMILTTGCGEKLKSFVETDLRDMVTNRILANQRCATQLYNSGLISESEYTTIMNSLVEKEKELFKANEGDKNAQQPLYSAIATFRTVPFEKEENSDKNKYGYTKTEWKEYIATNAIIDLNDKIPGYNQMHSVRGSGTVVPISIIDGDIGSDINARFGFPIHVLKTATDLGGSTTELPLDEIREAVNKAMADPTNIDTAILDRYFTPAKDSTGKLITLLDTTKRENKVVVTSDGADVNYIVSPDASSTPNKVLQAQKDNTIYTGDIYVNRPGKDMIVTQEQQPIFSIRFTEFNQDAVDKIIYTLGLTDGKYLVVPDNAGGRVYLLEYPVHYIKSFVEDGENFDSIFSKSNLGVNLKTGDFVKYIGAWTNSYDWVANNGVTTLKNDPYLTLSGATSNIDSSRASFSLYGNSDVSIGERNESVKVGRLVLKDYLEATYAPGVVRGENVVVFGRKIRIERFKGPKNYSIASYYSKEGTQLGLGGNLYISDFADIGILASSKPSVKYIKGHNESDIEGSTDEPEVYGPQIPDDWGQEVYGPQLPDGWEPNNDDEEDIYGPQLPDGWEPADGNISNEGLIKDALRKIDALEVSTSDKITSAIPFPSNKIGKVDNYESESPYFYAMAVRKGMFETGLFSGWINNTAVEENSLNWWNDWLLLNKFNYKIDKTILEEYLTGNYAYELGQQGILVLDLDTIAKIQEEYKEADTIAKNRTIRTMFMVLGAILIGYSALMLLAWVLDTNVDLGFNILEKMTFGHYVAVTDESELPQVDTESTRYIGFGNLVIKSCIIAVIGIALILLDFIQIGYWLMQIFGGIAKMISKSLSGF